MTRAEYPGILAINAAGRPGVAALDEAELDRLASISNQHFVAIDNANRVVGYLLAFHREAPYECEEFREFHAAFEQRFIYVDQIAIAEHHRGTGLGRRLYGVIQSVAIDQGIRFLCCDVNTSPPNPNSSAFHRTLGFKTFSHRPTLDGREVELLTKSL